ncbi:U6 snRNA-associated protein, putative [Perkinsus marinus ATCC 50983]|uniref:U6 snRNA-associated protein, putative n=1 Tax=Perkinsus marinus (strain ATCC 50983 / TXsc) TaxID=423536 RepID=C5LI52_PERM5|nr:U6 snRNA-associated protein, putative [Perkinsus marinus ATCC 50983]EER03587.1 U6 snRNA-associated protein, putative [Perkinsus marinus ATCC 50983]|eukprot:XP_002771771.1 U6 snRNA-associated protein, putative [Perkinsus marinus ATCC 50983]
MSEHHGKGKGYRGGKGKGSRGGDHHRSSIRPSVIDLERLMHQRVTVKLTGGREVSGVLKGFDPVPNLVLDESIEYLRDPEDPYKLSGKTRNLGLLVARGTSVVLVCPSTGITEIDNPFTEALDKLSIKA